MLPEEPDEGLSKIVTDWTAVHNAKGERDSVAGPARRALAERYYGAVRRYLRGRLPQRSDVAEDLAQIFCLEFLEGGKFLEQVREIKGKKFRNYLKRVLHNRAMSYFRDLARQGRDVQFPVEWQNELPAPALDAEEDDENLRDGLHDELLQRALEELAADDSQTGKACYALVQLRLRHPGEALPARQLAQQLNALLGGRFSENYIHVLMSRGRTRFSELLVQEVRLALETSKDDPVSADQIENELIELGLFLPGVKKALEDYRRQTENAGS